MRIDYDQIARRALSSIDSLLRQWLPSGKHEGYEYKALNPTRADSKIGSFSVNTTTGAWGDFATGDVGGDLISLYAYLHHLEQNVAAIELAQALGLPIALPPVTPPTAPAGSTPSAALTLVSADPSKATKTAWRPVHPVPPNAGPPPEAHYVRGRPTYRWTYLSGDGAVYGYISLFINFDGGKERLPVCYCVNLATGVYEWRWMAFAEPRPLYGLDRLAKHSLLPVLLVEGEKCADVAVDLLPELVIVTWPGGCNAVDKVDWSPLCGRSILAWADADSQREKLSKGEKSLGKDPNEKPYLPEKDQPGMKAMRRIGAILKKIDPSTKYRLVKIPPVGEKSSGWDIADAVAEGMDGAALKTFISNVRTAADEEAEAGRTASAGDYGWNASRLLMKNHELVPCLSNVFHILSNDPLWSGVLAYNAFSYQVMKLKPPPYDGGVIGEWDDQDDACAAIWLADRYRFSPTASLTADAAEAVAHRFKFHPVQDYLKRLKWDGTPRLDDWITDYIGTPKNEYIMRVARWFLIGMVARAMRPGVKFDYCLVLEGAQGRMKSAALRVLGGEWFSDTDLDLHNKDSMSAIRGKWLHEFAELGSLARSEATRQKSFLSRQIDEFRPPYGRREIRSPRQLVFGGTTNDVEWNKDSTGARRFWPVECKTEVNYLGLALVRDQLFAEAFEKFEAGERFWPTADEQRDHFDEVQMRRNAPETFVDMLHDWVFDRYDNFSLAEAATDCLKMDASKLTQSIQIRIGQALHMLGCSKIRKVTQATEKSKEVKRSWYSPPKRGEEGTEQDPPKTDPKKDDRELIPF